MWPASPVLGRGHYRRLCVRVHIHTHMDTHTHTHTHTHVCVCVCAGITAGLAPHGGITLSHLLCHALLPGLICYCCGVSGSPRNISYVCIYTYTHIYTYMCVCMCIYMYIYT